MQHTYFVLSDIFAASCVRTCVGARVYLTLLRVLRQGLLAQPILLLRLLLVWSFKGSGGGAATSNMLLQTLHVDIMP